MVARIYLRVFRRGWLGVWAGLELRLLCFIPFLVRGRQGYGEARVKYFLVQVCGSLILLVRRLVFTKPVGLRCSLILIALLLKLGAAPFHFWFPLIREELRWVIFYIVSTIQKVIPLVVVSYLRRRVIYVRVIFCGVIRALGGVGEIRLRKVLSYSSINHIGWLLIPIREGMVYWVIYFILYCSVLATVVINLYLINIYSLRQIRRWRGRKIEGLSVFIRFISLGGIPPLLGFLPKWLIFYGISCLGRVICFLAIILRRTVALFYYTRACFRSLFIRAGGLKKEGQKIRDIIVRVLVVVNRIGFIFLSMLFRALQ